MKIKNFPGRKNKRRISALARLQSKDISLNEKEKEVLIKKIIPQSSAEAIRTKKTRASKEKGKKEK